MQEISVKNNSRTDKLKDILRERAILIVLILLFIAMSLLKTDTFFTVRNLTNILRQITVLGIFSCGMTMVLISGNFDLSVGSLYSVCMVIPVLLQPYGLFVSIFVTILVGLAIGALNGFFVGKLKANAFIVTLGMAAILQGLALIVTDGHYIPGDPNHPYAFIGAGKIWNIPFPVFILVFIIIISHFILSKTTLGRSIYVTGGNKYAAFSSGINTANIQMTTFAILGIFCAVGGIITSSLIDSGDPFGGKGFEFDVITAAVLGGTSLFGGKGNILNTMIGVLLLGVLANSMIILGFPFSAQQIIKGGILVAAVYYDMVSRGDRL